jgi:RNA polymerase sigma-70 factor
MSSADGTDLGECVERAYEEAREHHGPLGLTLNSYHDYVVGIINRHIAPSDHGENGVSLLNRLHTKDLYVAAGCASGSETAWTYFQRVYERIIRELSHSICRNADLVDETVDRVMADLFFLDRSGRRRIGTFDGRSSLAAWLRVVVGRQAVKELKRGKKRPESLEGLPEVPDESWRERVEASLADSELGSITSEALGSASKMLTHDQRAILLFRFEQGLKVTEIARIYRLDASVISRQIHAATHRIRTNFVAALVSQNRTAAEIKGCLADAVENPRHSLLDILKQQ